jgi:hypothetical protein
MPNIGRQSLLKNYSGHARSVSIGRGMVAKVIDQYFGFTEIRRHPARFYNQHGSLFAARP